MASTIDSITSKHDMEKACVDLARDLLAQEPFDRGEVHAQKIDRPEMVTRELRHLTQYFKVPESVEAWQNMINPNLPWAEDHFGERVSGLPLNPPPSHEWWPFNRKGNEEHLINGKFSHTYPERFWSKMAGFWPDTECEILNCPENQGYAHAPHQGHHGIRFEYGDLADIVVILKQNPRSRQAYLPVWFPEDLTAARLSERVPCTLGYHFLMTPDGKLDCTYSMRSCDFVRFYRDDLYMSGRLLQWVGEQLRLPVGELIFHTANLHCFVGDDDFLREKIRSYNPRAHYNLGALG